MRVDPYLRMALEAVDRTAGSLEVGAIARPVEGRWSIAHILEHLTLAFAGNAQTLEKALASGEVRGRRPGLTQWLGRTLVIDLGYFPRAEAPERTMPTGRIPPERSVAALREALETLDATLTRASARFGEQALVANHPYFAGLNVPQWRKFHWQENHRRQENYRR